jgi:GTP-binding protein HflX
MKSTQKEMQKAVLVGIQLPKVTAEEFKSSLQELTRLVTTLGYQVVGQVTQKRSSEKGANLLGEGKLMELAQWTGGTGKIIGYVDLVKTKAALKREAAAAAELEMDNEELEYSSEDDSDDFSNEISNEISDENSDEKKNEIIDEADIVIVDCDLSPSQLRNLESATGTTVLDRTGVIIEIFSRHARTKAAQLQVEIARLTYVAPRLRETGGSSERQGGGIGGKGSGETVLELDKRRIRDRIKELKTELAAIGNEHQIRRARREQEISVALVGYTNAGKSSLMRALTGSEVLVADKLFATLDTTIRPLFPESQPKVLISDTVGFIKKLPHDLVASFKSTLDEALHASLLLFVVDGSDSAFRSQLEVTQKVLTEVGATDVPHLLVLNKSDLLTSEQMVELKSEFKDALFISTRNKDDVRMMREKILSYFEETMIDADFFVPYTAKGIIGEVRSRARVLNETYTDKGTTFRLRASEEAFKYLNKLFGPKS